MKTFRYTARAFVLVTSATALFAGCGGSSGTTKADYIKQANAVCADSDAKTNAVPKPASSSDLQGWAGYFDTVKPLARNELDRLKALKPPNADKATIQSFLALGETLYKQVGDIQAAAASGDSNAFASASIAANKTNDEANQIANSYGLDVCGRPS